MGVKSTRTITRRDATELILSRVLRASNEEIANALEEILGEDARFDNFVVFDDEDSIPEHMKDREYRRGMYD